MKLDALIYRMHAQEKAVQDAEKALEETRETVLDMLKKTGPAQCNGHIYRIDEDGSIDSRKLVHADQIEVEFLGAPPF